MKLVNNNPSCYNPKIDTWDYDEIYLLKQEIDQLLDRVGYNDEELYQIQVRDRIKAISLELGIHRDFLAENK